MGVVDPLVAKGRTPSGVNREGLSTDAGHWDGAARSSDEGPVMGLEPRGRADQGKSEANPAGEEPGETPKPKVKSFEIDKRLVFRAWEKVRSNYGVRAWTPSASTGFKSGRCRRGATSLARCGRWRYPRITGRAVSYTHLSIIRAIAT